MVLRLSDFEEADHPVVQQPKPPVNRNLLALAKENNLIVTSGYSKGGHNTGSKHYQGDAKNPGAIDVGLQNVTPEKIKQWTAQGYRVVDERNRPKGQAVWTGPHYHIEIAQTPAGPQPVAVPNPKPKEVGRSPVQQPLIAPFDLSTLKMPATTDASGNLVINQPGKQRNIGKEIGQVVKPEPKRQVADTISLSDFDLDQNDQAEIQAMAERLKPKPEPIATPTAKPKDPSLLEGLGNVANAAGQFIQSIPGQVSGAIEKERATIQDNALELEAAIPGIALEGVRNLAQFPADISAAIGNAYYGDNRFAPGYTLPSVREIPGYGPFVQRVQERHPILDFIAQNAIPVETGVGAIVKGAKKIGQTGKIATELPTPTPTASSQLMQPPGIRTEGDIIRRIAQSEQVDAARNNLKTTQQGAAPLNTGSKLAELDLQMRQQMRDIPTAEPRPRLNVNDYNQAPQVKELGESFTQRVYDAQHQPDVQIIDPRNAPVPKELGPLKTETTESGIQIATKAGQREIPQVEKASAAVGENVPLTTPRTSEILDAQGRPIADPNPKLMSGRDKALLRAEEISKRVDDADTPKPRLDTDIQPAGVSRPVPREAGQPSNILDQTGQPAARGAAREIELPNQPKPTDPAGLEVPKPFERPQPKEIGEVPKYSQETPSIPKSIDNQNVHTRSSGGTVYTQGRTSENVEALAAALEKNNQIIALEEAKRLLDTKRKAGLLNPEEFQKQSDVLNLFEEAGRTGKSFNTMRREIQEGMGRVSKELGKNEVKNREGLAPFAITVRQRKPETEVSNQIKRLGSAEEARNHMRQLAGQYGITPTTKGRSVQNNAVQIARQIAQHPQGKLNFQDIYLNAHNFQTGGIKTVTDAPRGYPLRTIESANIGTEAARIPEGSLNTNQIKAQYDALEQLKNSPDVTPDIKQLVTKVTDNPNVSFRDIRKMRESITKNLESFCNIWGLK